MNKPRFRFGTLILPAFFTYTSFAQQIIKQQIDQINTPAVALAPLRFLASDSLRGRSATRSEISIAYTYISNQFKLIGVTQLSSASNYYQDFNLKLRIPTAIGSFSLGSKMSRIGRDLVQGSGDDVDITAPIVYAGYGMQMDLDKIDVKGKIVFVNRGDSEATPPRQARSFRLIKQKQLFDRGAVAMIERYWEADSTWKFIAAAFQQEYMMALKKDSSFPVLLINDPANDIRPLIEKDSKAAIKITGSKSRYTVAKNILGFIEGTDPVLKKEYVALSAHYDHIGVARQARMEDGKLDSIYNGATDNATGVAAVLAAARYFKKHPPKRSILLIAFTAEELGLFGSMYFVAKPPVPLRQIVYNLNIDNGGYNDTNSIILIGKGRTSADEDIVQAASTYGLMVSTDSGPGLFERSDNFNFAIAGIPAPKYGLGRNETDTTIVNRYHELSDEVDNMHLDYIAKFINSYVLAAANIANNKTQQKWTAGDEFEAAWLRLYGRNKK